MKKMLMMLCAVLCAAVFTVGCGKKEDAASAKLDATFVLKVGFDADFPPYGFRNDKGELVGFDLDLAAEVAKRCGWGIELRPIDWDAKDAELDAGTINCIWNGFTINGREDKYTWSSPYVDNTLVFLVRQKDGIKTLADLAGKLVEVQADSSGESAIKSEERKELLDSFKKLVTVPDYNRASMELESGACSAVIMDVAVADDIIRRTGSIFSKLDEALSTEQYGVGFKLGNTELRDKVDATLRDMAADGTFAEISKKWFDGKDVCAL